MKLKTKVKSCPFCNKEAVLSHSRKWLRNKESKTIKIKLSNGRFFSHENKNLVDAFMIYCKYCFGKTRYYRKAKNAINAWNSRLG